MSITFYALDRTTRERAPHQAKFHSLAGATILRSLGYDDDVVAQVCWHGAARWDPQDLMSRLMLAQEVGGAIGDDGIPEATVGSWLDYGFRPGFLHDAYLQILPVVAWAIDNKGEIHIS
jgi:hypothetical protein